MPSGTVSIVGGGIAGLLAAVGLARSGHSVALFESASEPGGRARTRETAGFHLNQGPHALYEKGAFKRELDRLGIAYSGLRAVPAGSKAILKGQLHDLPISAASLLATSLFSAGEKLRYTHLMRSITEGATGEGSFASWLDAQKLSPSLRAALEALGRLTSYGNGPAEASAAAMLTQIRLGLGGTLYLDGGWSILVSGLVGAAEEAGVSIRTSSAVRRVSRDGTAWRLALESGDTHTSDAVLLALGPNEAAALAAEIDALAAEARAARPVRANTLDLALSRLPTGAHEFAIGIDAPFYVSLHSRAARLAPEGGAVVHLAKYLPSGEGPAADAVAELEQVADLVMPGWRPFEVKRQVLRGMTVAHALPRWDHPRPGVEIAGSPGLCIAGDWVGAEGLIADAAAASAIEAANAIRKALARAGKSEAAA